ncbi:MAG: hypothetical protein ACRDF4_11460 [Rhabdochlamydiaceae bacterium]
MKKTSPSTHQACRSLLQKAVRRGDVYLTEQVARHLYEIKDAEWLKKRTLVITFEECWPLGAELHLPLNFEDVLYMLGRIATARKMKDATGLGSLAYEYSTGVSTVLLGEEALDRDIQTIARAIKEPQRFWNWAIKQCSQDSQKAQFVQMAKDAHRRGGWPWDLAFMQAAAYLAITKGIPSVTPSTQALIECPLWVALDKHTAQGKDALRKAAKLVGVTSRQLMWISFYCESALTNESSESYWWSREIQWRLHQFELDYEKAKSIWEKAQQLIPDILGEETTELQKHFQAPSKDLFAVLENTSVPNSLLSDNSSSFEQKTTSSTDITHQKDTQGVPVQDWLFPPD